MTEKRRFEGLLRELYYDVSRGFQSQADLLKEARFREPAVSREDVRDFLQRQDLKQFKRTPARYNSFVPTRPRQQFQIDLMDWGSRADPRYALVAVDIFTKKVGAALLRSKLPRVTAMALREIIVQLGMPMSLMTDLGGEFQSDFAKLARQFFDIPLHYTRSPPRFVERAIGTLRKMLKDRIEAFRQPWHRLLGPVVEAYNEKVHSATGVMPDIAAEEFPEVTTEIRERLEARAKPLQVKHPELRVGDLVKIFIKKGKFTEFKSGFREWSDKVYKVEAVETMEDYPQKVYKLEGMEHPVLRHNLLKIKAAELPDDGERALAEFNLSEREARRQRFTRILE